MTSAGRAECFAWYFLGEEWAIPVDVVYFTLWQNQNMPEIEFCDNSYKNGTAERSYDWNTVLINNF